MLIDKSWDLWVMGPPCFHCATLINIEHKGNMRMQVPIVSISYFKYVHMWVFSYNMRSRDSQSANNDLDVTPCCALQNLNHLVNSAICLFKLRPSKAKEVQQLIRKTHN